MPQNMGVKVVTKVAPIDAKCHDLLSVRAGFIAQGTSFHAWCIANKVDHANARKALIGKLDGPAAKRMVVRLKTAAGVKTE